ncbi:endoglucanase II [Aspergillus coremiiformis]|uniref:cellulase n=1 Tax=Aspergillus coremiiformis TaxID=138285 RepID=A0A5N6Z992_9EURO|nr:endoglucanase II [Aspergillus coremiiformis]
MKFRNVFLAAVAGAAVATPVKENKKRASVFQWIGSNQAGAEFTENNLPGVYGRDYIFPETSSITTLIDRGMNAFRIQFKMERLVQGTMTGSYDENYLRNLTSVVNTVTDAGVYAILDAHNYGRFFGQVITSTADFQTFWRNLAEQFRDNQLVIFDTNNEYNNMDQNLVLDLNQAAINGIREAGATEQYIFVEGNAWSGAWSWTDINDNMKDLQDPQNRIVYEMHQYLDGPSSGTSETCVSGTIGQERLVRATQWLRDNQKIGVIGEFAGGNNDVCKTAVRGMLEYMAQNTDVWKGALWWAAGPWWNSYMYSMEPPNGIAYSGGMLSDVLQPFLG